MLFGESCFDIADIAWLVGPGSAAITVGVICFQEESIHGDEIDGITLAQSSGVDREARSQLNCAPSSGPVTEPPVQDRAVDRCLFKMLHDLSSCSVAVDRRQAGLRVKLREQRGEYLALPIEARWDSCI